MNYAYTSLLNKGITLLKDKRIWYFSSFFTLILIEFLISGIYSKILSTSNYALYVGILNYLPFYNILMNFGIGYSILYLISFNIRLKNLILLDAIRLNYLWFCFLVALHFIIIVFFNNNVTTLILISCIISSSYSFKQNITNYYLAQKDFINAAITNLIQKIFILIIVGGFLFFSLSNFFLNNNFKIIYTTVEFSASFIYLIYFFKNVKKLDFRQKIKFKKRIFSYGKYVTANSILSVLYYSLIVSIIGYTNLSTNEKILLSMCMVFFRYTGVIISPLLISVTPNVTNLKADKAQLKKYYNKLFSLISTLSIVTSVSLFFVYKYIVIFFYDERYHDLSSYFSYFCLIIPFLFLSSLNGIFINSLGKVHFSFKAEMISTLLVILFFIFNFLNPVNEIFIIYIFLFFHMLIKSAILQFGALKYIKQ